MSKTPFTEAIEWNWPIFCVKDTNIDTFPTNLSNHSAYHPATCTPTGNCNSSATSEAALKYYFFSVPCRNIRGARPRIQSPLLFLRLPFCFLGASFFFGGRGEEEIREPYFDGSPTWDRKQIYLQKQYRYCSGSSITAAIALWPHLAG